MPTFRELTAKRLRLSETLHMMTEMQKSMLRDRDQGHFDAGMAAAWAAVLLTADIIKDGMSAADPRAAMGFNGMDRAIDGANKLLKAFHRAPIQKKADALAALDPDLRKAASMTQQVEQVRDWLKKLGMKENAKASIVLDVAVHMTQDTLLMLQAGKDQTRLWNTNSAAITQASNNIDKVRRLLKKVDDDIQNWLVMYDTTRNIA